MLECVKRRDAPCPRTQFWQSASAGRKHVSIEVGTWTTEEKVSLTNKLLGIFGIRLIVLHFFLVVSYISIFSFILYQFSWGGNPSFPPFQKKRF